MTFWIKITTVAAGAGLSLLVAQQLFSRQYVPRHQHLAMLDELEEEFLADLHQARRTGDPREKERLAYYERELADILSILSSLKHELATS